jgi:hypothetical protein
LHIYNILHESKDVYVLFPEAMKGAGLGMAGWVACVQGYDGIQCLASTLLHVRARRFNISPQGVIQRDAAVWQFAQRLQAPIMMLLSGGYTRASAGVIVDSIAGILQGLADSCSREGAGVTAAVTPAGS